jgi:hypothetical protein
VNSSQKLGVLGCWDPFPEVLLDFARDLPQMVENLLQAAIALQELRRSLGADPLDTGNVVGRVTAEGFVVDHLPRPDAEFLFDLLGAKFADAIFAVEVQNPNPSLAANELKQILVAA